MNKPFKAILVISLTLNLLLAVLFIQEIAPRPLASSSEEVNSIDPTTDEVSPELLAAEIISTRFGERDFTLSSERDELFNKAEILEDFDQIMNGMDNIYKIKFGRNLID